MAETTIQLSARTSDMTRGFAAPGTARGESAVPEEMTKQDFSRIFGAVDGEPDVTAGREKAGGSPTADDTGKRERAAADPKHGEVANQDPEDGESERTDDATEDNGLDSPFATASGADTPTREEPLSEGGLTGQDRTAGSADNLPPRLADTPSPIRVEPMNRDNSPPDQTRLMAISDRPRDPTAAGANTDAPAGRGSLAPEAPGTTGMEDTPAPGASPQVALGIEHDRPFAGNEMRESDTRDRHAAPTRVAPSEGHDSKDGRRRDGAFPAGRASGLNGPHSVPADTTGDATVPNARKMFRDFETSASGANGGITPGPQVTPPLPEPGQSTFFRPLPETLRHERERANDRLDAVSVLPAQRDPALAGSAPSTQPVVQASLRPDMTREMAILIHRKNDRNFDISLQPEELGHVRMSLRVDDGGISVLISADRPVAQDLMRRHADQLSANLQSLGYDSVDIEFADHGGDRPADSALTAKPQPDGKCNADDAAGTVETIRLLDETRLDLRI